MAEEGRGIGKERVGRRGMPRRRRGRGEARRDGERKESRGRMGGKVTVERVDVKCEK